MLASAFAMSDDADATTRALDAASEEHGLASYYRACVRPLLGMPETRWPTCCGGCCEPCSQTLVDVARRTKELLGA